jgi:hypothetical protein
MYWLYPFFYMESKFGPSDKRIKQLTSIEMKFFRRTIGYTLLITKEMNFERAESSIS